MSASLVAFFRPWLTLAVFALIVIPVKLLVLRIVPRNWRAILESPVQPWRMWAVWIMVWAFVIYWADSVLNR